MVLGYVTGDALLHRGSLSFFISVDKCVGSSYLEAAPLWAAVHPDMDTLAGLMIVVEGDWSTPWSPFGK